MNELLKATIDAHGGLDRWNALDAVSARLLQDGAEWALKGQAGVLADVFVRAGLHEQRVYHHPFGAPDRRSAFTPQRVAIETTAGDVIDELDQPLASFEGHTLETPWSAPQLAYFVGVSMWTYLTQPFTYALPGFEISELKPWQEKGEEWRRLRVVWPSSLTTHSSEQTLYIGADGLLWRHDYDIVIQANAPGAHYFSDYVEVAGIKLPTRHRIVQRTPDGQSLNEPVLVSIDLSEIAFT
jgi:hypothetical protein